MTVMSAVRVEIKKWLHSMWVMSVVAFERVIRRITFPSAQRLYQRCSRAFDFDAFDATTLVAEK